MIVKHNPSRNKQFINFQDGGDANSIVNNNPILMIKSSKYINSGRKYQNFTFLLIKIVNKPKKDLKFSFLLGIFDLNKNICFEVSRTVFKRQKIFYFSYILSIR